MEIRNRALAVILSLSAAVLVAGCDGGGTATGNAPDSPAASPAPQASAPDPAIQEAISAAPSFAVGHTVHVTTNGIQPRQLVSMCCAAVVFKNETNAPVSVFFDNMGKISSGPIAPGASWQWTPDSGISFVYHLGADMNQKAAIQIEWPAW